MSGVTRRGRARSATEREILTQARELLVREGREAVTLRAIARNLGMTAPALYRYFPSREELLHRLVEEICSDLAEVITARARAADTGEEMGAVLTVCRTFRGWALAHPTEFELVFASQQAVTDAPTDGPTSRDQFGSIFLRVIAGLPDFEDEELTHADDEAFPEPMRDELVAYRREMVASLGELGVETTEEQLTLSAVYLILRWWSRLYGHVALEVFQRFPFTVSNAELLFESLLAELVAEASSGGACQARTR
ncbi:TetR/AcrR family transcriptional regulator [Actinoalloteichus sp. AHMU CJ021]|uniref:TetR/AcrR family transcriptional regulator n=1 Tax=Actinoalloteichus cyanogriseus TaxID=2893586 RepID=UPI0009DCF336|nr:TetR/AcrR family transcriptional regulator [Actinoalloteichus caeruleus]AUS78815.1 TetR/AcrR family transcriptional regulator [Actinoalloteichus sp. AHMU CJ021]